MVGLDLLPAGQSKLNSKNDFVHQMSEALGRFPVLSDGIKGDVSNDFGGSMKRYVECFPLHQCKDCFYRRVNRKGTGFMLAKTL